MRLHLTKLLLQSFFPFRYSQLQVHQKIMQSIVQLYRPETGALTLAAALKNLKHTPEQAADGSASIALHDPAAYQLWDVIFCLKHPDGQVEVPFRSAMHILLGELDTTRTTAKHVMAMRSAVSVLRAELSGAEEQEDIAAEINRLELELLVHHASLCLPREDDPSSSYCANQTSPFAWWIINSAELLGSRGDGLGVVQRAKAWLEREGHLGTDSDSSIEAGVVGATTSLQTLAVRVAHRLDPHLAISLLDFAA